MIFSFRTNNRTKYEKGLSRINDFFYCGQGSELERFFTYVHNFYYYDLGFFSCQQWQHTISRTRENSRIILTRLCQINDCIQIFWWQQNKIMYRGQCQLQFVCWLEYRFKIKKKSIFSAMFNKRKKKEYEGTSAFSFICMFSK